MKIIKSQNYEAHFKNGDPVPKKVESDVQDIWRLMREKDLSRNEAFNKVIIKKIGRGNSNDEFINSVNTRLDEIFVYY